MKTNSLFDHIFSNIRYSRRMEKRLPAGEQRQIYRDMKIVAETNSGFEKLAISSFRSPTRLRLWKALMTGFLKKEFNLDVPDLVEKWENQCWTCDLKSDNLSRCSICQTAKYCGKNCQMADRKFDEILDRRSKHD